MFDNVWLLKVACVSVFFSKKKLRMGTRYFLYSINQFIFYLRHTSHRSYIQCIQIINATMTIYN